MQASQGCSPSHLIFLPRQSSQAFLIRLRLESGFGPDELSDDSGTAAATAAGVAIAYLVLLGSLESTGGWLYEKRDCIRTHQDDATPARAASRQLRSVHRVEKQSDKYWSVRLLSCVDFDSRLPLEGA